MREQVEKTIEVIRPALTPTAGHRPPRRRRGHRRRHRRADRRVRRLPGVHAQRQGGDRADQRASVDGVTEVVYIAQLADIV